MKTGKKKFWKCSAGKNDDANDNDEVKWSDWVERIELKQINRNDVMMAIPCFNFENKNILETKKKENVERNMKSYQKHPSSLSCSSIVQPWSVDFCFNLFTFEINEFNVCLKILFHFLKTNVYRGKKMTKTKQLFSS